MEISSNHSYRFPVPRGVVWEALADVSAYRAWWPWLRRFEATGMAPGAVWRCVIRPPLPYAIRCSVELTRVRAPELVMARVTGDIVGLARVELTEVRLDDPTTGQPGTVPITGQPAAGGTGTPGRRAGVPERAGDTAGATARQAGTEARITSRLEARRLPARLLARAAPPAARWGHDWVFDTAARQFRSAVLRDATRPGG